MIVEVVTRGGLGVVTGYKLGCVVLKLRCVNVAGVLVQFGGVLEIYPFKHKGGSW